LSLKKKTPLKEGYGPYPSLSGVFEVITEYLRIEGHRKRSTEKEEF
jgi:hypothetical protein